MNKTALLLPLLTILSSASAENPVTADPAGIADQLYEHRAEFEKNIEALSLYEKAIAAQPERAELYWKASRAAWWAGSVLKKRDDRLKYFDIAIKRGEEAVRRLPQSVEAHFWLGGAYGSYGDSKGVMKSLSMVKPIRREMAEVNRLDERYTAGGAHRILGIMDYKLPGFAGGDKKRAKKHLERALELDPAYPVTLYYLAEYHAVVKEKEIALDYLNRYQKSRTPAYEAEWRLMQDNAAALQKALK